MIAGNQLSLRYAAALLICGSMYLGFVSAQPDDTKQKTPATPLDLPQVLQKNGAPANVAELRDIEKHVQKVLEKIVPAVVGVRVGFGQGSGVIISEDGYILTAGHVSGKPNQDATITFPNGKTVKAKTLGQNKGIDSGLMKITDEGKYPFLDMGRSRDVRLGQWVLAIGHPGGFRPNRTPVVPLGRVLTVNPFLIRSDCTLVGGDSGGPLFNMQGQVIGIHSRIGGQAITENIHVPVDTYKQTWTRLARGDSWNDPGIGEIVRSAGGQLVFEKSDTLASGDPRDKDKQDCYCKTYTFPMKAGSTYTIEMIKADRKNKKGKKFGKNDPTQLDPYLRLESPNGKEIAQDDDGAGDLNSRIVYKAIKDGTYRIIATSCDGDQTGSFTLKIYEAEFKDALVSGKVDLLKAMKIPLAGVAKLLEDSAKDKKRPHINAMLIDDKGDPLPGKEVTLVWEMGKEKLTSDKEGVVRWPLIKDKAKKLVCELPNGARAMLGLTDVEGNSLSGLLKGNKYLETVKSPGGKIISAFDGTLSKKDPFDVEREECFRHVYPIKMQAGKTYTIDLMSDEFNAFLRLEHDDKGRIAEDDDGAGALNARIVFTPSVDGVYRIVVTSSEPREVGSYRTTIRATEAKSSELKN